MRTVFAAYERICAGCSEMVQVSISPLYTGSRCNMTPQLADPIIETLEKYLLVLRGAELLDRAFAV